MDLKWALLLTLYHFLLPLNVLLMVLIFLYKTLVCLSAKIFHNFVGPIPPRNFLFTTDPIWTKPYSSIVCAIELEGHLTKEQVVEQGWQYAYNLLDKTGSRCYGELGYTPVYYYGYVFWKRIKNFIISDQVHVLETHYSSDEQQEEFLLSFVENLQRKSFAKSRPLWDAHLLHNYKGQRNHTLMIIRYHHMMADGLSFVKLLYDACKMNLPQQLTQPTVSSGPCTTINNIGKAFLSFLHFLSIGLAEYIYVAVIQKDINSINYNENGEIKYTNNWISGVGKQLDIKMIKKASKFYQCSISHIILAGVCKGVENYMGKYHNVPKEFHYSTPIPIPGHPNYRLVNHWCTAKFSHITGINSPSALLKYTKTEYLRGITSTLPVASATAFQYVCGVLPVPILDAITQARGINTVIHSNLVGPQNKDTLFCDMPISNLLFWLPITHQTSAISVGAISYNGKLNLTLTADDGFIPSRDKVQELGAMIADEILCMCQHTK